MTKQAKSADGPLEFSVDPSSVESIVSSHKRQLRWSEECFKEAVDYGPDPTRKRGLLGLTPYELLALRQHATKQFYESARLSEELRQQRQKPRSKPPLASPSDPELYAVFFARICDPSISEACGEYADLLTQAVLARRGRKALPPRLMEELWSEALRFRMDLAKW